MYCFLAPLLHMSLRIGKTREISIKKHIMLHKILISLFVNKNLNYILACHYSKNKYFSDQNGYTGIITKRQGYINFNKKFKKKNIMMLSGVEMTLIFENKM